MFDFKNILLVNVSLTYLKNSGNNSSVNSAISCFLVRISKWIIGFEPARIVSGSELKSEAFRRSSVVSTGVATIGECCGAYFNITTRNTSNLTFFNKYSIEVNHVEK